MICPYCQTENRDDRATCYNCEKDLSMLRLIVNKAKAHFNSALEHAERGRNEEAIAELHNALDLDNNLVNAHVVLGTLYAKTDQLEKAEEQWHEALELDPRMAKAHQYLEKLDTGRRKLPVVRRLRAELIFMTLLAIVLLIAVIMLSQPDPGREILATAERDYAESNYAASLDTLSSADDLDARNAYRLPLQIMREMILAEQILALRDAKLALETDNIDHARNTLQMLIARKPSEETRRQAMEILAMANAMEEQAMLAEARAAVEAGTFTDALAILQKLDALEREPAPITQTEKAAIRAEAAQVARDYARRSVEAFRNRAVTHEQTLDAIERARKALPAEPGSEASAAHIAYLNELESQSREIARVKEKQQLLARHQMGEINEWQLLEELTALREKYPDDPSIPELIETFSRSIRRDARSNFRQALEDKQFETAQAAIATLKRLHEILRTGEKPWENMQAMLERTRSETQIARLREAYENEQYEKVLTIAEQIEQVPDETTRAVIDSIVERANSRLARRRFEWMLKRDYQYQTATMSVQTAEKTIREFEQVFEHLPTAIYPTSRDNLLLYLANSYRRLGQNAKAIQTLERLLEKYPDSNVKEQARKALEELQK